LSNEYIDFVGTDIAQRIEFIRKIILFSNVPIDNHPEYVNLKKEIKQKLEEDKISFIYSPYPLSFAKNANYLSKVYENQAGSIYKVDVK
jgi:predicted adenine nucleotide alpha hydrolase (AANH) superfamily ATPase